MRVFHPIVVNYRPEPNAGVQSGGPQLAVVTGSGATTTKAGLTRPYG